MLTWVFKWTAQSRLILKKYLTFVKHSGTFCKSWDSCKDHSSNDWPLLWHCGVVSFMLVREWGRAALLPLITSMHAVVGKIIDQSHCQASVSIIRVTDLVLLIMLYFSLAEFSEVLVTALEILHEEIKPLGLKVSWTTGAVTHCNFHIFCSGQAHLILFVCNLYQ